VAPKRQEVDVAGRRLSLSNLDKVLYPEAGFTKGHVIDYYMRIAPYVLDHLRGRPLTLKRYPNGVEAPFFYEKQCPSHRPDWVRTAAVYSRSNDRTIDFCLADDIPTLVWLANLADLELHTSLALAADVSEPTVIAFDLDPGAPATVVECAAVALELRAIFGHLGLEAFAKTSGSKGMQVYVPLNTPVTYNETKTFALALAQLLERRMPELVVSDMKKELRKGRVLVDWSQNDQHKTTVCVYSLRARPQPTVSTPVTWDEVEAAGDPEDLSFRSAEVLERVAEHGDLFAPVVQLEQSLPTSL
jgi:bifunctional non-homologous end joining protein LigD